MIIAKYFIGDESIEYHFDETESINNAIDHLAMLYYEKQGVMPIAVYLSLDLYHAVTTQNVRYNTQLEMAGIKALQFHTSIGVTMVKPVAGAEKFIYAGSESGFKNAFAVATMDKHFEDLVLEVEDET